MHINHPSAAFAYEASPSPSSLNNLDCVQAAIEHVVPPFYFPGGKPVPEDVRVSAQNKIDAFFEIYPDGLTIPAVKELVKEASPRRRPPVF